MKNNYFIAIFTALALCFGQLASNTHVLNHLSVSDEHNEVGHNHHHHALTVLDTDAQAANEHGAEESLECGIYHTYAGSNCLSTVYGCDIGTQYKCVNAAVVTDLPLPIGISDSPHIRGPPNIS